MPAPEQSPVTEEGLLLTIRDSSTGRSMEGENTANNILASVKEQVNTRKKIFLFLGFAVALCVRWVVNIGHCSFHWEIFNMAVN